ncbi:hypothetical protein LAZ67_17002662 [Cordylochernes scorpioides]|uniref:Uncharacterized protein n=1 Tax=Cordylochernes scorpioides TaxID=51811 RepID=A0ABY6LE36_9ARAC|nr:hypothetical protein LAZ67_17002662 [Cordylochernes scorpioides]
MPRIGKHAPGYHTNCDLRPSGVRPRRKPLISNGAQSQESRSTAIFTLRGDGEKLLKDPGARNTSAPLGATRPADWLSHPLQTD